MTLTVHGMYVLSVLQASFIKDRIICFSFTIDLKAAKSAFQHNQNYKFKWGRVLEVEAVNIELHIIEKRTHDGFRQKLYPALN